MTPMQRRLFLVGALTVAGGALAFVAYGNLGENLVYYWDPSQLVEHGDEAYGASIRLGGLVKAGSVDWDAENNELRFEVTDDKQTVAVINRGAPPQMFREGIGVVVEGTMVKSGTFESDRLMVKHSNEYRAPEEGVAVKDLYSTVEEL